MSNFPTLAQVANILAEEGHSGCAIAVNRARNRIAELEETNSKLLAAYQALLSKYEPRPKVNNDPVWTGD